MGRDRYERASETLPHAFSNMSSTAVASASAAATAVVKAPPQGGVLEGVNPVHFDAKNPIILFIVQVRLSSFCFRRSFGAAMYVDKREWDEAH